MKSRKTNQVYIFSPGNDVSPALIGVNAQVFELVVVVTVDVRVVFVVLFMTIVKGCNPGTPGITVPDIAVGWAPDAGMKKPKRFSD